jgi:hypothetical protein
MRLLPENAGVAELVDALDLGSSIARCESSSLSSRTIFLPLVCYSTNHRKSIPKTQKFFITSLYQAPRVF